MKECIDIYSRLLLATITFVVPIIITLLSTFTAGEKRRKELAKNTEEKISKQAAKDLNENPAAMRETIHKTSQQYKDIEKTTQSALKLLNPIIQFWNIFGFLAFSFISLLFDYLIRGNYSYLYNHSLSIFVLALSGLSYMIALALIIRIFYTVIRTKRIIEN